MFIFQRGGIVFRIVFSLPVVFFLYYSGGFFLSIYVLFLLCILIVLFMHVVLEITKRGESFGVWVVDGRKKSLPFFLYGIFFVYKHCFFGVCSGCFIFVGRS